MLCCYVTYVTLRYVTLRNVICYGEVPENSHLTPWKVIGNSEGEGVLTAKIYEGKCEA